MARICVVGLWHQAAVASACLADLGHHVRGVGDDEEAVARLNRGDPPVYEPKLKAIMRRNIRAGRLKYTTDYREAVERSEFAYIAIDTPVGPDGESDVGSIFDATRRVARVISRELILIVGAQVPVGTCERLAGVVRGENPAAAVEIAYVPEFLRLGMAVATFRHADRIVVGADDPAVAERIAALYRPLGRPVIITDRRTAEMAKHASNAFLAASLSFINEVANLCDEVGADAARVADIMRRDRRIGRYAFLDPGLGFAGGTLAREVRSLQALGRAHRCETPLMDAVMCVNRSRVRLVGQRLQRIYESLAGLQVGILGLTYKPGTSTLRGSIALEIIRGLVAEGASVKSFDPLARLDEVADLPPFTPCPDPYVAAQGCDALVLLTEWNGIRSLDLRRLQAAMRRPLFIDTRNVFDPAEMSRLGFIYSGVGRGARLEGSRREATR